MGTGRFHRWRGICRVGAFVALAVLSTSCALFHPHHKEGAATATTAGDVNIQFAGVTAFTTSDLNDALFDEEDEIKNEGLKDATADDLAFFLELYYRKNGYAYVSVNYTIADAKHLALKVNEGPLVALGDIRFTGNDHYPDTTNFQQYIIGQTRERFPAKQKTLPYVETDVQKGTDLVQRFYVAEGYLEAQVGVPTVEFVKSRTQANVTVPIVEGRRYKFGDVAIDGEIIFPPDQVRKLIADQIPLPYTRPRVDDMQRRLEGYYKKKGYFTAEVTYASDPVKADADGRVQTTFTVKPGPLYHFDGVRIVGTDRLKPEFLQNRFKELSGKVYDPKALEDLYQRMIRTGLFQQLKVDAVPQPDDTLRLDIGVKEARSRQVGFSVGYDTFEGILFGVELRDRDFNGTGRPISLSLDYSTRTLSGLLLYQDPYLFETDVEFEARLNAVQRQLNGYEKNEVGGQLQLTKPITKKFKVSAFYQLSDDNLTKVTIQQFNAGREKYTASSLGGTASLDLRDNPVTPTKGLVTAGTLDIAADALGSSIEFVRGTYRISYLKPIGKNQSIEAGFRLGIIKPFGNTGDRIFVDTDDDPKTPPVAKGFELPIDERFFLGGSTTVRSFVERELGPFDQKNGNPIGGEAYTVFNLEYQFPLKLADLKGAVFFDAGNLRPRAEQFGLSQERYGIGPGLRYSLPIGALRLDYGINPDPHPHEKTGAFQFSFGLAF